MRDFFLFLVLCFGFCACGSTRRVELQAQRQMYDSVGVSVGRVGVVQHGSVLDVSLSTREGEREHALSYVHGDTVFLERFVERWRSDNVRGVRDTVFVDVLRVDTVRSSGSVIREGSRRVESVGSFGWLGWGFSGLVVFVVLVLIFRFSGLSFHR